MTMKTLSTLIFILLGIQAQAQFKIHPDSSFYTFLDSFYHYYQDDNTEGGIYNQVRRDVMTWGPRLAPTGDMSRATKAMMDYAKVYNRSTNPNNLTPTPGVTFPPSRQFAPSWRELGPVTAVIGGNSGKGMGQIHRLAFHPNYGIGANKTIYAGSHYAGLYRSDDAGGHWYNYHTDRGLPMTSVGGVAVAQSGKVFVCTGNGDFGFSSFGLDAQYNSLGPGSMNNANPIHTQGVYAIDNNTTNWYSINGATELFDSTSIGDLLTTFEDGGTMRNIIVHPTNENILLIATSKGIFRTIDGGSNWKQVLVGLVVSGTLMQDSEWRGLEFHPMNPDTVYASGKEVYKSVDGGATWNTMNIASILTGVKRINIAVTPANTARVYAYAVLDNETSSVCWHDGTTWNFGESTANKEPAWLGIAVSPLSDSIVFVAGIHVDGTDDFGTANVNFSPRSYRYEHFHDDVHALVFPPNSDSLLFAATHGGVSKKLTSNNGTGGWTRLYEGLGVATIWAFDDWEGNDSILITANQDVGVNHTINYETWRSTISGGDGYGARIDDQTGKAYLKYNGWRGTHAIGTDLEWIVPYASNQVVYPLDTVGTNALVQNAFSMKNHPKTDETYLGFSELYTPLTCSIPYNIIGTFLDTTITITHEPDTYLLAGTVVYQGGFFLYNTSPAPFNKTCSEIGVVIGLDTIFPKPSDSWLYIVDTLCYIDTTTYDTTSTSVPILDPDLSEEEVQNILFKKRSDLRLFQPDRWNRRIMEIAFSEDEQTNYTYLATLGDNTPNGQRRSDFYFNDSDAMSCDTCFVLRTDSLPIDTSVGPLIYDPNPITGIAVDPLNGDRVWASFSGFSRDIKVYYSDNAGESWTSYDDSHGSLAALNVPINHIVYQRGTKDRLYIATDVGVYVREDADNGGRWYRYGEEFPNVRTVELKINYCTGKLRVATFGRGAWEIDLLPVEETVDYRSFRVIDVDQIWTADKHMSRDIRVKSGITLTLDSMTLNMPKNGLIVIERGGKLIVNNSIITNLCGETWEGIEIEGTPTKVQLPFNKLDQGWLVLRGSTVEYAKNAILNCVNLDFSNTAGGIVNARESTFKNNWRSAAFMQYYSGTKEASSFLDCTFTVDDDYRPFDMDTLPDFLGHISMWNVVGLSIRACTFKDERSNKVGDPATGGSYGIYTLGATPRITSLPIGNSYPPTNFKRNRFEGLERGIEIGGESHVLDKTSMIDQCDFVNNEQALKIDKQKLVQITRNNFLIGGFDSQGNNSNIVVEEYGLGLVGASGFTVEQNTFKSTSNDQMVGSWIEDTGTGFYRLRNNSYDSLLVANLAHGLNDGLQEFDGVQYLCNKNKQNLADFVVYPNPNSNNAATKIGLNQGSSSESSRNTLSLDPSYQFYNDGEDSMAYWYAPQPSEVPDVNKLYQVQDLQGASDPTDCQQMYMNSTHGTVVTTAGGSPLGLPELKSNYEASTGENEAYFWINQVLNYYANDSTGIQTDSIETWILKKTDLYARYELVEHYWQQKRHQEAISYLDTILNYFSIEGRALENHNHYKSLKTLLWNAYKKGRTEAELKKTEVDELRDIAEEKVGFASVQAASIVRFFYGNAPTFYPALPNWNASEERKEQEQIAVLNPTIWGYPNPTSDWVEIVYELPNEVKEGVLEINAVSGQIIQKIKINQNNGTVTLNTTNWSSGIYFATLRIEGMRSNTYKIVIRK